MLMAMSFMTAVGLLMVLFPGVFVRMYTTDPEVIPVAINVLRVLGLIQPFFSVFLVLSGALRGAGDTKYVMTATIIGNWGIRVILALILAFFFNVGLVGFWLAMAIDLVVRAGLIFWRYQGGVWKKSLVDGKPSMVRKPSPQPAGR